MQSVWRDALRRAGGGLVVGLLLYPAWGGGAGTEREREVTVGLPPRQGAEGKTERMDLRGTKPTGGWGV